MSDVKPVDSFKVRSVSVVCCHTAGQVGRPIYPTQKSKDTIVFRKDLSLHKQSLTAVGAAFVASTMILFRSQWVASSQSLPAGKDDYMIFASGIISSVLVPSGTSQSGAAVIKSAGGPVPYVLLAVVLRSKPKTMRCGTDEV